MVYLKEFYLLNELMENSVIPEKRIYNNYYPTHIFPLKELKNLEFSPITFFYGGNGSGKSTLLNIIASKLNASRKNFKNKGEIFDNYVAMLNEPYMESLPVDIKLLTSDDVFDYLLSIQSINSGVNRRKYELEKEYLNNKYSPYNSKETFEDLIKKGNARTQTMSKYIRNNLVNNNIAEQSNGQSALMFWQKEIEQDTLYLLDEPENSLSAENQVKLAKYIEEATRFYNCQFIISTHSPFLLSLKDACIYDLDSIPVCTKKWTELDNVLVYYNFFKNREDEFK